MGGSNELPDAAHELFAAPVEEFIKKRDSLASDLTKAGQSDQARAVKALRKPTLAIWATNQASRREPHLVQQLLEVSRTMQAAGSVADLRSASAQRQSIIRSLVDAAIDALREGGHASTGTVVDKVTRTLLAISSDEQAQRSLSRGTLERDLAPDLDFGFIAPPALATEPGKDAERFEQAQQAARALEQQVRELQSECAELEHAASDARERAVLAQIEADRESMKVESAQTRLRRRQADAADAQEVVANMRGG